MTDLSGRNLGNYQVLDRLGAGGMGEVYRARDTRIGRTVALKVLIGEHAESSELRARFEIEARAIAMLSHPSICTLFDVGEDGGTHFLVMELLEGETLAKRLERGALPVEPMLALGAEIAGALAAAHRRGVIHRDLKPGNVMLTKGGVKLLDFGLARLHAASHGLDPSAAATRAEPLTAAGQVMGTFQYMSPEQVEGREADARSDIFALGAVLYEMASGKRPFDAASRASIMAAVLQSEPPPVTTTVPGLPAQLDPLIRGCLAKDPDERWQSAADVAKQLAALRTAGGAGRSRAAATRRPRLREALAWTLSLRGDARGRRRSTSTASGRTHHVPRRGSGCCHPARRPPEVCSSSAPPAAPRRCHPPASGWSFVSRARRRDRTCWVWSFGSGTAAQLVWDGGRELAVLVSG